MVRRKVKKRRDKNLLVNSVALLVIVGVIYLSAQYLLTRDASSRQCDDDLTALSGEMLQKVATNPALEENLVRYKGMTVSFNTRLHIPNWVAWELTGEEAEGTEPRYDRFVCDERVAGCAETWDYSYSGYDRGHMAPAGDMKWDKEAMMETFYMTNICPQAPELNRGSWKRLEEKCRARAGVDSAVIVVCGPVLTDELTEFIGDSRVTVPKRFFKVILSPYRKNPVAIGFIMPNGKVPGGMQPMAVTVDSVEAVTGHDFFAALPDSAENKLERMCDFNSWSRLK